MTYRYLTTLADALRKRGLTVVEINGWKSRGRPASTGDFNPVGVLWHHTGSKDDGTEYARWLAVTGRSDLPAPLCQLSIGRDGTVYVCAAGRANHAGVARASGTVAGGDGNALYVGVECQNSGTEGWSAKQRDAMVLTAATLSLDVLGCSSMAHRAHKETSVTGKWDPGALDMDAFRADVATKVRALLRPPHPTRVARARALLEAALRRAKGERRERILRALNRLKGLR